mmetsp:Transcript_53377/g.65455  ORF Transcript_53377/g.65455 Transcript_53377/m.65455 type:complete len:402 (-) Transcript_53377:16-1221(-)
MSSVFGCILLYIFCVINIDVIFGDSFYDYHYVQTTTLNCGKVSSENRKNGECIIPCNADGSCSYMEANCHPYDSCTIECRGNDTCHNLRVDSRFGIDFECIGHNSCQNIVYNAHDTYNERNTNKEIKPLFNWDNFNFTLPYININASLNIPFDKIQFGKNFIALRNYHDSDTILNVKKVWHHCREGDRNQKRSFGNKIDPAYNISGHNMTYLNDCFPDKLYNYFKQIMKGMLLSKQIYTLNHISNKSNITEVHSVLDNLWSPRYNWQSIMSMANIFETRVIEYIRYNDNGNLGWHFDQESNITMINLMSNENDFVGGVVQFRDFNHKNNTDNIENVTLHNGDIIMFPSIASHCVTPISFGVREVLVLEYWNIPRSYRVGRHGAGEHLYHVRHTNNPVKNEL